MSLISAVNAVSDAIIIVILVLLCVACMLGVVVLSVKWGGEIKRKRLTLLIVFLTGFVLRLIFALCIRGYREDYRMIAGMFDHLANSGLAGYYTGDASSVLYPIVYFIYLIFGGFSNVTGLSGFALGEQFMVKLPMIIAELLTAYAVYKLADKYADGKTALILCALVCACPVFFVGTIWSSTLVFTVCFICFAAYALARKSYIPMFCFYAAAAFSSREGVYVFPVVAVFAVYHIIKAARNIKADGCHGKAVWGRDYNAVFTVPIGILTGFLGAYLIGLFMTTDYNANPFVSIYDFTLAPLSDWTYFTYNGLSIYSIFSQNGQEANARFPVWVIVGVFAVILTVVVCVLYFTRKNRATMVMLMAYALFTMQVYYPGTTAMGMVTALAVVLAAYALLRDKRLLTILYVSGLAFLVNALSVLSNSGYLNNLADYYYTQNATAGASVLTGGMGALSIVCSVITLLAHLYFTVVAVGVGMTGQTKPLKTLQGASFGACIKEYFSLDRGE